MGLFDKFKKRTETSAVSPQAILVSNFLSEKNVAFFPAGPSKRQVFGNLIGSLELPDPGAALKAILAREEAGSTVIAPGLALPHARIAHISKIQAALGICPSGIHYGGSERGAVRIILLFLGPAENMREHLAFLAQVSSLFQKSDLHKALLESATPEAALKALRQMEKSQ